MKNIIRYLYEVLTFHIEISLTFLCYKFYYLYSHSHLNKKLAFLKNRIKIVKLHLDINSHKKINI